MFELDGPRREPKQRPTRSLVVLLHGYGASGEDLIPIADAWAPGLPDTAFIAPHAPQSLPFEEITGFQWFPLTFRDPDETWRGARAAAPALDQFLDRELARYGLIDSRLALVGFSQGTMMALHVGLRRRAAPAALIGYSGLLAGPEHLSRDLNGRPPILLIHGAQDEAIPVAALHFSREALAAAGLNVEWHVCENLGHGISEKGLALGRTLLSSVLA